jgi:hypothetical protein
VPVAIKRRGMAVIHVDENGSIWLRYGRHSEEKYCEQKAGCGLKHDCLRGGIAQ